MILCFFPSISKSLSLCLATSLCYSFFFFLSLSFSLRIVFFLSVDVCCCSLIAQKTTSAYDLDFTDSPRELNLKVDLPSTVANWNQTDSLKQKTRFFDECCLRQMLLFLVGQWLCFGSGPSKIGPRGFLVSWVKKNSTKSFVSWIWRIFVRSD